MPVYSYSRVSTLEQESSLEVQKRTLEAYATTLEVELDRHFVDSGVSGSVPLGERQQGALLVQSLLPGDTVLVTKFDRLFRDTSDALNVVNFFKSNSIKLYIMDLGGEVTDGYMAKAFFTIMGAFAELERNRIRERIQEVKTLHKTQGKFLGGRVPWGYVVDEKGYLQCEPWYDQALEDMAKLRFSNKFSYRKIAKLLSGDYKSVSHKTVRKVIGWIIIIT